MHLLGGAPGGSHIAPLCTTAGGGDVASCAYCTCLTFSTASVVPVAPDRVHPEQRAPPWKVMTMPVLLSLGVTARYSHTGRWPYTGTPSLVCTCAQKQSVVKSVPWATTVLIDGTICPSGPGCWVGRLTACGNVMVNDTPKSGTL